MKKNILVQTKLDRYKLNTLWINNIDKLEIIDDNSINDIKKRSKEWKRYISLVNSIFENMNQEHANLIKAIYLDSRSIDDLCYSQTTFYLKHKRAVDEFLKFFNF